MTAKTMRAAAFSAVGEDYKIHEVPIPEIGPDDVLVKIEQSGICHSDCDSFKPKSPEALQPVTNQPVGGSDTVKGLVGGHEGAGTIVAVGANVASYRKVGDRVGVPILERYCNMCKACQSGNENYCTSVVLRGFITHGTWQEYTVARGQDVIAIPDNVSIEQACPILCAGLTVYKGLKLASPSAGQFCVVPGAGGGLGHLAVQYAKAMGLRVVAIDSGAKKEFVQGLGAEHFIDFTTCKDVAAEVIKLTNGGTQIAIMAVGHPAAYQQALTYMGFNGKIIAIGLAGFGLHSAQLIIKGISIIGMLVGTRQDCAEALDFVARGLVKCSIETREMSDIGRTLQELEEGKVTGRVVINVAKA